MARESRAATEAMKRNARVWRIAIYIRLSREDAGSNDESESVSNQRAIIEDHIAGYNDGDEYAIVDEYIDDGVSGTTDDERADFQRMLADIQKGRVNCVIVKDLARSFRNYSDQGYYLDDWFPRYNVRFISLYHQPLDSYKEPQNMRSIAVPIQGVLNENHCAETSDKIREVFDMKRRSGEHIGSFAAYGYKKDPARKNALVVDEEAAEVVQKIFQQFLAGESKNSIVRYLNDHGILCPTVYKRERQGLNYQNPSINPAKRPLWCAMTVTNILKNRMYCGDMVQGRYRIKSYKVHVQETVPEDEWYIVENTHEAIIDRDTFAKAQRLLLRNTRTAPQEKKVYLFSGFLRCADCGKAMSRSKVGETVYYYCRTYKDQSKKACTKHRIKHDRLEAAVLFAIQLQVYVAVDCPESIGRIGRAPRFKSQSRRLADAIEHKERELAKIVRYKQAIYQDWKDGELTHSDYRRMREDYAQQAEALNQVIERLRAEQAELDAGGESPILKSLRQYGNIHTLTRDILIELVDHIKVFEDESVSIVFRFADGFRRTQALPGAGSPDGAVQNDRVLACEPLSLF